jgi:hypothetical protein
MSQVELPPCRGPRSPLDLVAIKIIFGHIFEAFHRISQADATIVMSTDDNKPVKRFHRPLKKVLVLGTQISFSFILRFADILICVIL